MTSISKPIPAIPHDPRWPRGLPLILDGVKLQRGGVEILRGVDLRLEPTARYVLIGPSGAGKSTLLRLLNRLDDPSGGEIRIGDTPPRELANPGGSIRRRAGVSSSATDARVDFRKSPRVL